MADGAEEAGTQKAPHQCVHVWYPTPVNTVTGHHSPHSAALSPDNGSDHVLPA